MDPSTEYVSTEPQKIHIEPGATISLKDRRPSRSFFKISKTQVIKSSILAVASLIVSVAVFSSSLYDRSKAALLNLQLAAGESGQVVCADGRVEVIEITSPTALKTRCVTTATPSPVASPTPQASSSPSPSPSVSPSISPSPSASPSLPPGSSNWQPFGTAHFTSAQTAFRVNGAGVNVDTIAFWEAPDPANSLMFVTSKNVSLVEVWKYPFQSNSGLADIKDSCLDSNTNGVIVDQETDELYVVTTNTGKVCVYNLPGMTLARSIQTAATSTEPNLALLKTTTGEKRLYVTSDNKVYVFDAVTGTQKSFSPFSASPSSIETAYADNYYQKVYVPSEHGGDGIHVLSPDGVKESVIGIASIFGADEEGIWLYTCPKSGDGDNGTGLIFVSDQTTPTQIEVFDRVEKTHLGTFTIDGVDNTDGIALTQQSSPNYPQGVFAAINNDTEAVGIGLDVLLQGLGLSCVGE